MWLAVAVLAVAVRGVSMSVIVDVDALVVSPESHEQQAEHIKGRDKSGDGANDPIDGVRLIGFPKNFVLAPEACQRGNSSDRSCGDQHDGESYRNISLQSAHVSHVLLASDSMDDGSGTQKEQALEEGMGHQMEDSGRERADAASHEHVSELRNRRVGEDFFDVGLRDANGSSEKS